MQHLTHPKYRADIDGLRAIAVLAVIFFHIFPNWVRGGFVGVDVFFVISGYLITSLINADIHKDAFSVKTFYLRRIRRLSPALLAMLVPVSLAALVILKPEDMRSFALSLALQFVSLQNVFFLIDGEYFRGADMKPLLHTWSLAVEEQFYLFWPLFLLFTRRLTFRFLLLLIGTIIIGSFLLNLVLISLSPKASFFLAPTRAWELGIGGVAALLDGKMLFQIWLSKKTRIAAAFIGLFAVLISITLFSAKTPFPGVAAILPVLGTFFLLASKIGESTIIGQLLTHPLTVRLGLISYPVYLWHWPIIACLRQFGTDPTEPYYAFVIVLMTFGLAEITYRFIELPIRHRIWLPGAKSLLVAVGSAFFVLIAFGIHSWISDGAAYRFAPSARAFLTAPFSARSERCGFVFRAIHPREQVCALREEPNAERRVLLWGNSHADMWSGFFATLAAEQNASLYLNARNCRATPDSDFCGARVQQSIFNFIISKKVTDVVLASTWYGSYGISDDVFEREFLDVVHKLSAIGVRTWIVIDPPAGDALNPIVAFEQNPRAPQFGAISLSEYVALQKRREQSLFEPLSRTLGNVKVIDPSLNLCAESICPGGKDGIPWYRDSAHLTDAGAMTAKSQFVAVFVNPI